MNNFIKQHKYLIILFILFSVIAIFSWFKITNDQLSILNKFSNNNFQNPNEQTTTTSPPINQSAIKPFNTSTEQPQSFDGTEQTNTATFPVTSYELLVTSTSTVYDAMKNSELNFKTKTFSGLGEFVEEINGLKNDPQAGKYWIYYVNTESAKLGISQQIVYPNDLITWNYETANL